MKNSTEKKDERLSMREELYCVKRALERLSQKRAYEEAFGRGKMTDKSVYECASRVEKRVKVRSRIAELQESLAEKALWTKAEMVADLKDIASECKIAKSANEKTVNTKARAVSVNAIKTASEILGYKSDNEVTVNVNLKKILEEVAGEDY